MPKPLLLFLTLVVTHFGTDSLSAAVTRIEIKTSEPYAEGRVFDSVGAYERCRGKVFFAVDPKHPATTCAYCALKPLCRIHEEHHAR